MDEPFGALDAQLKLMMQAQLLAIWQATGKTVVFVTHDLAEAVRLASRVVVFSGRPGRIKAIETVPLAYPRDPFKVRFNPQFETACGTLWAALAPEIAKGTPSDGGSSRRGRGDRRRQIGGSFGLGCRE